MMEFTCSNCNGEFLTPTTEEERQQEADLLFPGLEEDDKAVVCDSCFNWFMKKLKNLPGA